MTLVILTVTVLGSETGQRQERHSSNMGMLIYAWQDEIGNDNAVMNTAPNALS